MGNGGFAKAWEPGRGERAVLAEDFSNIRYFRHFETVPVFYAALHVNLFSTQAGGTGEFFFLSTRKDVLIISG